MSARDQILKLAQKLREDRAGPEFLIHDLLLALLADGSVLLESCSAPVAESIFRSLARSIHADSCRIPFVHDESQPDSGYFEVHRATSSVGEFLFQPALIFSNLILLEGVHHAPTELLDALLSAIAEREVVVAGNSHPLPALFMVVATENSFLDRDSHALSAEQRDRFLLHSTPKRSLEDPRLVGRDPDANPADVMWERIRTLIPQRALFDARTEVRKIRIPPPIAKYISALARFVRCPTAAPGEVAQWLDRGPDSPRAMRALDRVSQACAWFQGRSQVTIDDVVAVAPDCLRHRIVPSLRARAEGKTTDSIIELLLNQPWVGDQLAAAACEAQAHK